MKLVAPPPLPDELAVGFAGRIRTLNAIETVARTLKVVRSEFGGTDRVSSLSQLAAACSSSTASFALEHSMLPLSRAVTIYVGSKADARVAGTMMIRQGLLSLRENAMACPCCIDEDRKERGFSYWRRRHHLPGIDWCFLHQIPLQQSPKSTYHDQPWMALGQVDTSRHTEIQGEMKNTTLQRLARIQEHWLQMPHSIHAGALNLVLKNRCTELDLRCSQHGKRPVISDIALDVLPESWIKRYFPSLLEKRKGEFLQKIDGPAVDRHVAYPSFACALVLSVLFDNTHVAFEHIAAANEPYLHRNTPTSETAAHLALQTFQRGMGLIDACLRHGADQRAVERLLRLATGNQSDAEAVPKAALAVAAS
ncbi:MAG: hypothetical protein HHJ17_11590 [Rhodoferax sp.]|uniref:TniQ family protein n=1 Tax=Rhodoferax sp. TaxID=50421 RepID=UPI00182028CE|nr:TniQ family protein [Rhodoferax sp.]NMM14164.1 hypothetical protein [Rhodoferax sp.]